MPWRTVILLSKSDQLPTFYPLHFQCCEISLLFFVGIVSSETSLSLLLQLLSSFMLIKLAFTKFLWLHIQSLQMQHVYIRRLAIYSVTPFTFSSNFTSNVISLFLCCTFIYVGQFPTRFFKHRAIYAWIEKWKHSDQSPRAFEKSDKLCICYLHFDLWIEEAAANFVVYAITVNISGYVKFEQCCWGTGVI